MAFAIAMDEGCLLNCNNASFGSENPYESPITWILLVGLLWPVPLMLKRLIGIIARLIKRE